MNAIDYLHVEAMPAMIRVKQRVEIEEEMDVTRRINLSPPLCQVMMPLAAWNERERVSIDSNEREGE